MLELSGAAVLVAVTFGLVEMLKASFPAIPSRLLPLVVIVIGLVSTIVTANSDWGDSQKIGDKVLSDLNGFSLVVVSIAVGAVAAGFYKGVAKVVANIGQNHEGPL